MRNTGSAGWTRAHAQRRPRRLPRWNDVEDPLERLARQAVRVTDATACLIAAGPPGSEAILAACGATAGGLPIREPGAPRFATGGPRRPVIVRDALKARKHRDTIPAAVYGMRSWVLVPLRGHQGRHCGVIVLGDMQPRKWKDEEVRRIEEMAERVARELEVRALARRQWRLARALHLARRTAKASRGLAGLAAVDGRELFWVLDSKVVFATQDTGTVDSAISALHLEDRAKFMELEQHLASTGMGVLCLGIHAPQADQRREVFLAAPAPGGQYGLIGYARPLVEVRDAETSQTLRERTERMRLVERATADLTWEWNLVTGDVLWDAGGPNRLRYAEQDVRSEPEWHAGRVHPEDRERVVAGLRSAIDGTEDGWADEYRFMRGDGTYATVMDRALVVRTPEGRAIRVLGWKTDISERTRAEEGQRFLARAGTLLDSELDVRMILQNLARVCVPRVADCCMIDMLEADGRLVRSGVAHVNPDRERDLEPDRAVVPEAAVDDLLAHVLRGREPVLMAVPDVVETAATFLMPVSRERLGIRSFVVLPIIAHERVLGTITLATTESDRVLDRGDLGVLDDLAKRAGLALENARLYEKAQDAIRAREEVLRIVSHDLRDPLNTIVMSTTVLADARPERRTEVKRMLNTIQRAADQMDSLISDLLDTTSMASGGFALVPGEHTVGALIEDVRDLFEPLAEGKDIKLVVERPADLPVLHVDQRQMTRVLSNLVGNALKFTPDGGTVTIRALRADGDVWFEIRDTGPGIAAEYLDRVFDRFFQADQYDRRGAGLGLAIAKGIVEAHGGRIWVESRIGAGSSFFVALPVGEFAAVPSPRSIVRGAPGDIIAAAHARHSSVA